MRALVFAQVNKKVLEEECSNTTFDYRGYAENFLVMEPENIAEIISGYEILICEFETISKYVLDRARKLKLIICCRGGIDTVVDVSYAKKLGIKVCNTPGRNSDAVAEYVLAQILEADRNLAHSNSLIQDEVLQKENYLKPKDYKDSLWGMDSNSPYHVFRGKGLCNITLGIIGYGKVGKVVANKASVLGMKVLATDLQKKQGVEGNISFVEIDELFARADYISVHCSNSNNKEMFDKKVFEKMKKGVVFINTARGDLINEDDLIHCVSTGIIKKAILDVTREEPLSIGSKLVGNKNIVITPHIAGATDSVIDFGTKLVIEYINDYAKGIK